jgi:polar amino acid transport system substrate-binding protein
LSEIRQRGTLSIGLDPSFLPFAALAGDGNLFGLDVDLGHELAARLGVEPHFVLITYDGLYHALEVGQVDVLISALVVEPGRSKKVSYSTPYVDVGLVLVTPSSVGESFSVQDLAGQMVAVEIASQGDAEARRWARRVSGMVVVTVSTADDAMAAVLSGEAAAAMVDGVAARLYLREHTGLTLVNGLLTSEPYAVAVRSEDKTLLRALNEALAAMAAGGTLDAILGKWL